MYEPSVLVALSLIPGVDCPDPRGSQVMRAGRHADKSLGAVAIVHATSYGQDAKNEGCKGSVSRPSGLPKIGILFTKAWYVQDTMNLLELTEVHF